MRMRGVVDAEALDAAGIITSPPERDIVIEEGVAVMGTPLLLSSFG
jgi:hypothetical protein